MISDILAETADKMSKSVDALKEDFATVRTGRANPALFQKIMVEYYGTPTPLAQLGSLQNPEARTIIITPYDKGALKEIERAIVNFPNLGATPTNDGNIIRVTMPELTEERRKEYVKIVRAKSEDGRVAIRNVRRKGIADLEALKEVGEDEISRAEKEIEAITKKHIDAVDEAFKKKEAELLEV
ncbi:ribosome recycling factor [Microbacteriaceae bacterium MWH-Ta3]|nr:ribosome recycling factor [Microbacteriaceae bacterium MWH-Ta3]